MPKRRKRLDHGPKWRPTLCRTAYVIQQAERCGHRRRLGAGCGSPSQTLSTGPTPHGRTLKSHTKTKN